MKIKKALSGSRKIITEEQLRSLHVGDKISSPEGLFYEIVRVLHEAFQAKCINAKQVQQNHIYSTKQLLSWMTLKKQGWSIAK